MSELCLVVAQWQHKWTLMWAELLPSSFPQFKDSLKQQAPCFSGSKHIKRQVFKLPLDGVNANMGPVWSSNWTRKYFKDPDLEDAQLVRGTTTEIIKIIVQWKTPKSAWFLWSSQSPNLDLKCDLNEEDENGASSWSSQYAEREKSLSSFSKSLLCTWNIGSTGYSDAVALHDL